MNSLPIKAAVRARDGNKCVRCGITNEHHLARYGAGLEVHRKKPGSAYTLDGCELLCKPCHGPQVRRGKGERILADGIVIIKLGVEIAAVLVKAADDEDRSFAKMGEILVREALAARGLWPPKEVE